MNLNNYCTQVVEAVIIFFQVLPLNGVLFRLKFEETPRVAVKLNSY